MISITALRDRFKRHPKLHEQVNAYRATFLTPHGKHYVLADIAEYCAVGEPMPTDLGQMQRIAGRQDVWLRIRHFLDLTDDEIFTLLQGAGPTRRRME